MSEICISSSMDDQRSPVRATYENLYKWPESDAEFVKAAAVHGGARLHSRVMDSISGRQTYLKSYTFSREETLLEKTLKCFGKVRKMVVTGRKLRWHVTVREMMVAKSKLLWRVVTMEVKDFSAAAFRDIFRRLRSCTTPADMEKLGFRRE